jgi:hypothetical protein
MSFGAQPHLSTQAPLPPPVAPVAPIAAPEPAPVATAGGVPSNASITRHIEELGRLRDQGLITEAEFQAKKAELLRRL